MRQRALKTILWGMTGVLAVVTAARFIFGLGAVTSLTDVAPWGIWIAFDVMAGVALAAGGFVIAATVYIFGIEKYHSFARPAILTAFLGYIAVAVGLLYDLGLPWHIWHPIIFPQPRSVLFEVAMCVMLYLSVLFLEFSPAFLEHPWFDRPLFRKIHRFLKRYGIVFVIMGVVLSTLHQSSLGSLFLIAPQRLHPLWYSPYMWVFFFISAIGLGLMMVTLESFFSAWFFSHELEMDKLQGLAKAASPILLLYAAARFSDLAIRGKLSVIGDGGFYANLFLFEMAVSALIPAALLAIGPVRRHPTALFLTAAMTVFGVVGYRFDVCLVAFARPEDLGYFPSWTEIAVSAGIVSVALLVFIFFGEHLKIYDEPHDRPKAKPPQIRPGSLWSLLPERLAAPRRYSLAFVVGAAVALVVLPSDVLFGDHMVDTPVSGVREVDGTIRESDGRYKYALTVDESGADPVMVIDGNRDGRQVLFSHPMHEKQAGNDKSCPVCHHQNMPLQKNSPCSECHRDMYKTSDIFDHRSHQRKLGGNESCLKCHEDYDLPKTRETAVACDHCHENMAARGTRIKPEQTLTGLAPSYMDAMHGLCIGCHEETQKRKSSKYKASFRQCANCHRGQEGLVFEEMAPYKVR